MCLVRYSIVTPYVLKEYEYIDYTLANENIESTHAHTRHFSLVLILFAVMLVNNFMRLATQDAGCSAALCLSWAG